MQLCCGATSSEAPGRQPPMLGAWAAWILHFVFGREAILKTFLVLVPAEAGTDMGLGLRGPHVSGKPCRCMHTAPAEECVS